MKKACAVLLVLATAGRIFAQETGTFKWGAEVRLGVDIDLKERELDEANLIRGNDHDYGKGSLTYSNGSTAVTLEAGSRFLRNGGNNNSWISSSIAFGDGVNGSSGIPYKLFAGFKLVDTKNASFFRGWESLSSPAPLTGNDALNPDKAWVLRDGGAPLNNLYGWYTFFGGQLRVEAFYKGWDEAYWTSPVEIVAGNYDNPDGKEGFRIRVTPSALEGFSAGFTVRNAPGSIAGYYWRWDGQTWQEEKYVGANPWTYLLNGGAFGVKYDASPLTISAAYHLPEWYTVTNYHTDSAYSRGNDKFYIGGKYRISPDQLWVGADLEVLNLTASKDNLGGETQRLQAGVKAEYTAKPLTAGAAFRLGGTDGDDDALWFYSDKQQGTDAADGKDAQKSFFGIAPFVYYDLIKDTIQVRLPLTFNLSLNKADGAHFFLEPGLYWNFKRNGAGDDPGCGILLSYKLGYCLGDDDTVRAKHKTNASGDPAANLDNKFTIKFRWNI
ncbi:MAG: hypothetical protein LBG76_05750 [Treponema sp.]|jgi:hypothetical protein|nr:hypothetical protein [Treponema sp.]